MKRLLDYKFVCLLILVSVSDCSGQNRVTAQLGSTVTLPCGTSPQSSAAGIEWVFLDHNVTVAYGLSLYGSRDKYNITRVNPSSPWSLVVKSLTSADQGHYMCRDPSRAQPYYVMLQVTGVTDAPSTETPRIDRTACCRAQNVSAGCMPACAAPGVDLATFNFNALCATDLLKLVKCFSGQQGHVPCCRQRNIPEICFDFCLSKVPTNLDMSTHLPCLYKSSEIIQCYQQGGGNIPGSPRHVLVTQYTPTVLSVAWLEPLYLPEKVEGYRIHWRAEGQSRFNSSTVESSVLFYHILYLIPETRYYVYITAFNGVGLSKPSEVVSIRTPDLNYQVPIDLNVVQNCCRRRMASTCASLLCDPSVDPSTANPILVARCVTSIPVVLKCLPGDRNLTECCLAVGVSSTCSRLCGGGEVTATSLSCMAYLNQMRGCIGHGWTLIPSTPKNFTLVSVDSSSALLSWSHPAARELVQEYILRIRYLSPKAPQRDIDILGNQTSKRLVGLTTEGKFSVELFATNSHGWSLPSQIIEFMTIPAGTSAPPLTGTSTRTTQSPIAPQYQQQFQACCKLAGIPSNCSFLCTFDIDLLALATQNQSLVNSCASYADRSLSCAADGRNHTPCCEQSGVPASCLDVCYIRGPEDTGLHHLACMPESQKIFQCYKKNYVILPRPPNGPLRASRVSPVAVLLSWGPSPTPRSRYVIRFWPGGRPSALQTRTTTSTTYMLTLRPGTFEISVVAANNYGESVSLPHLIYNTRPTASTTPPPTLNFERCCRYEGIPSKCMFLCDWDIDIAALMVANASLLTECGDYADNSLACGADGRDHTHCCTDAGVSEPCRDMCYIRSATDTGLHHLSCISDFMKIFQCYKEGYVRLPKPVYGLMYTKVSATSISLRWRSPNVNGVRYLVQWSDGNEDKQVYSNRTSYVLAGLKPHRTYEVVVIAENSFGRSVASDPLHISVQDTVVTSRPHVDPAACCKRKGMADQCLPLCTENANVSSVPLGCYKTHLTVIDQCVGVGRNHTSCCTLYQMPSVCFYHCMDTAPTPIFTQRGTTRAPAHEVCSDVYAQEIWSCRISGQKVLPSPPRIMKVESKTDTTVTISWKAPSQNYVAVSYRVFYWIPVADNEPVMMYKNFTIGKDGWNPRNFSSLNAVIERLVPGSQYSSYVIAVNAYGVSLPSNSVYFSTSSTTIALSASIIQTPEGIVNQGDNVVLRCATTGETEVQWYFSGDNAISAEKSLRLVNVGAHQAGRYTCTASNGQSSMSAVVLLRIRYKPEINDDQLTVMSTPGIGATARLQCAISGFPTVVKWMRKGAQVQGRKLHAISSTDNLLMKRTLIIDDVTSTELGHYQCVARNAFGEDSQDFELVGPATHGPGVTTSRPPPGPHIGNPMKCCMDGGVTADCLATCDWTVDPALIQSQATQTKCLSELPLLIPCVADGRDHTQCCRNMHVNEICMEFCEGRTPRNLTDGHIICMGLANTILTCMKENSKVLPTPPRSLRAQNAYVPGSSSITVTWLDPYVNSEKVTAFTVQVRELPHGTPSKLSSRATHIRLDHLSPNTAYEVIVRAINFFGSSQPSDALHFTAPERSTIPAPPAGSSQSQSKKVTIGVGAGVGGLVMLIAVVGAVIYCFRKRPVPGSHSRLEEESVQYSSPSYSSGPAVASPTLTSAERQLASAEYVDSGAVILHDTPAFSNPSYSTTDLHLPDNNEADA